MQPTTVRILFAIAGTCLCANAPAAPFRLLQDIYPGPNDGVGAMAGLDTQLFFWGYTPDYPTTGDPWRSDGSSSGTAQIGPGIEGSAAQFGGKLIVNDRMAFFVNDSGFGDGLQLWRSDSTGAGTFELTHLSGGFDYIGSLATVGDYVVFYGGNVAQGFALRTTDGSVAGTQLLDATVSSEGCAPIAAAGTTPNAPLLCLGYSGSSAGLILTDGTPAGTTFVAIPALIGFGSDNGSLQSVNEFVYFAGQDSAHGTELWKTDGTAAGTALVKDISAGANSSLPANMTRVDDRLFFTALDSDAGRELWISDGTNAGTTRVRDIHPGLQDSSPDQLTALDGILYFVPQSDGSGIGQELWRSDGTSAGTTLALGDFNPDPNSGAFDYTYNTVQVINHKLALVLDPGGYAGSSTVPYVSDGTLAGTHVMDSTQKVAAPYGLVAANGRLFAGGAILPSSYGNELIAVDAFAALDNTWCAAPEQPIPDNDLSGTSSRFHLPSYGGITDLSVSVDIGHTYVGDLQIALRHEQSGTEVMLVNTPAASPTAVYSCSGALLDITFDDGAATGAEYSCVDGARPAYPWRGHYRPLESLSAFRGESLSGDWTLTLTDFGAGDRGVLHEWCMSFSTDRIFGDNFD